ncbi:MAG TPA: NAD(P)H-dependent oxidoreductase [Methanomassiliicoccaceae archaeon]|jgi:multimeric flavodoxin WrbA|nr:flavodoxin family protein [Euryarchaeota archaeon]HOB37866.1 NAD(P)H-dependent oxidoreductase [Methanomassiliicoccaceae archaeon]HOL07844.1 NAD(P)H-dependent oxidoreductase [Methanomassiliicoccaceae archaeon]HPP44532.1 NAD(P)H-dependent oxidoreductase [Methanomassiliicoccaceae archaeon]HPT73606.1 NAD(P)H-dependent oxidoreductase [Methanomassiliicoccaceae archaeon]
MTFVLGIAGSPRRGGNTELLLDAALQGAAEGGADVRKIVLSTLSYSGCISCGGCDDGCSCVVDDDLKDVHHLIERADAIILASPIYFEGLSSQLKAMIDRGQVYWIRKYVLGMQGMKRRGAIIAVGARRNADFQSALRPAKIWFLTLDADMTALTYGGFEEKASILDDPDALNDARSLGRNLVSR